MSSTLALSPTEAALIANNAYFTLKGWEDTYKFQLKYGDSAKGAPKPVAAMESFNVVEKNVVGAGPVSLAKTGLKNATVYETFPGRTGVYGRANTGFGYVLQFTRSFKKHLVVAVRGTRPEIGTPDLVSDAMIGGGRAMSGVGPIHAGFYDIYKSLVPTLMNIQEMANAVDVVHCVGHSMGGAVANLVALHLKLRGANIKLYTFAAPRVGTSVARYDKKCDEIIGNKNIYRVSHNCDPVTMIPIFPYIHAIPDIKNKNNILLASPIEHISFKNHSMDRYCDTIRGKNWQTLRSEKIKESFLDKQYFTSWIASDNFLKQYIGVELSIQISILQRVLRGALWLSNVFTGVIFTGIATYLDLLAHVLKKMYKITNTATSYVAKFIRDSAMLLGMGVEITQSVLEKLFRKLVTEMKIMFKMAIATANKTVKAVASVDPKIILGGAALAIGFLHL